jgi:AraC-like DNA-binding protein
MRRLVISTDEVGEGERFSYWCAAVSEGLIGIIAERNKDQESPFKARLVGSSGGSVARIRCRADGHPAFRRLQDIARRSWHDHFLFYREFGAGAWFGWNHGELFTRPGELMFADPTVPFATKAQANYDYDVWVLPRKLLDPHLPAAQRPRSLVLASQSGLAGIIKAYLDAFGGQIDALNDPEVDVIADNFCRLLAVACGGSAGEQHEAIRLARLEEAKQYIGLHLADPELTPEKAAAALKISVRQLHLLFEPSGTSFAQHVLSRRLEECRAALMTPSCARSVTDIALAWGFNSLATFHRNFRQEFGATPGELRAQAGGRA